MSKKNQTRLAVNDSMEIRNRLVNLLQGPASGQVTKYFFISLVITLLSDIPNYSGVPFFVARVLLFTIFFGSLLAPIHHSLSMLLIFSVVGQDIVQSGTEIEEFGAFMTASIWQGSVGPLRPSWIVMIYCFIIFMRSRIYYRDKIVKSAVIWFLSFPVFTGVIYGLSNSDFNITQIIVDIKFPIMLISSIYLYRSVLKRNINHFVLYVSVFVGAIFARHLITFFYWLNGIGSLLSGVNTASVGSTKGTIVVLFLLAALMVLLKKKYFVGGVLGAFSGLLIVVYATRMIWIAAVLGLIIIILMLRFRRWTFAVITFIGFSVISYSVLNHLSPDNIKIAIGKGDRFSRGLTKDNYLEQLDPVRYEELLNFVDANMRRFALLWGSGYGGFYTESARKFSSRTADAFPVESFISGKYYTCHNYVFLMLFKYGLVGFMIISALWIIPGNVCFKYIRSRGRLRVNIIHSSLVAFLPTSILCLYWSGKGNLISGFLIAYYLTVIDIFADIDKVDSLVE